MLETGTNCTVTETFNSFPLDTKPCLNAIPFQLNVVVQNTMPAVQCRAWQLSIYSGPFLPSRFQPGLLQLVCALAALLAPPGHRQPAHSPGTVPVAQPGSLYRRRTHRGMKIFCSLAGQGWVSCWFYFRTAEMSFKIHVKEHFYLQYVVLQISPCSPLLLFTLKFCPQRHSCCLQSLDTEHSEVPRPRLWHFYRSI